MEQESANFFLFFFGTEQIENILGFVYYTVSVANTHFCYYSTKTGKDNTSASCCGCVPIKLHFLFPEPSGKCSWSPDQFTNSVFRACRVADEIEENNFLIITFTADLIYIILCFPEVFLLDRNFRISSKSIKILPIFPVFIVF